MRKLKLAAAALVMLPSAADAQEFLPLRTWTGFHVGVHASLSFGAQLGYDHQIGPIVAGVEADASIINVAKQIDERFGPFDLTTGDGDADWLATLRGRVGFTLGRLLLYGTGGLAFTEVEALAEVAHLGAERLKQDSQGWTLGVGVEGMVTPNLTARAEWLYADFPRADFIFHSGLVEKNVQFDAHVLRAALNYKFNP